MAEQQPHLADNLVYDLVSIQYHAMKGAHLYASYLQDARGHNDIEQFIRRAQEEDARRAAECHELLTKYTKHGIERLAA